MKGFGRAWLLYGGVVALAAAYMVFQFLDAVVYGVFFYYITRSLHKEGGRIVKMKRVSAVGSLLVVVLPVTLLLTYTLIVAFTDASDFLANTDLPYVSQIKLTASEYAKVADQIDPNDILKSVSTNPDVKKAVQIGFSLIFAFLGVLFRLFLVLVVAYHLLMYGDKARAYVESLVPEEQRTLIRRYFNEADKDLNSVFTGNILMAALTALSASLLLFILNAFAPPTLAIPYPFLLGILTGFSTLIPIAGVAIITLPIVIYLTAQAILQGTLTSDWTFIATVLITMEAIIDAGLGLLFRPLLVGRRINPSLMMYAYIFGPLAFGFMGLLLGPMILVLLMNFLTVVRPEIRGEKI
ncbi:AI-2E family transporter [uncultured archaeon]|nr:AI-2E family transporter [uncultured archaeon]